MLKAWAWGAVMALAAWAGAQAQTPVKIGLIYPLSGNAASAGQSSKAAIEIGQEIVNGTHPELAPLPLAKDAGLPGLGGAKVEIEFADNQGTPAAGQNQALRLITESKVQALVGAYQSGITLTASAVAEKYGIPFLSPESVATNLSERGFKWFFRTTPIAPDLAQTYMDFFKGLEAQSRKIGPIAIVNENTEYGTSIATVIREAAKQNNFTIGMEIAYGANATDVQAQVLQLKDKKPDVVIFVSYTSDAILYAKTMRSLDYRPPIMIADDAGFSDPSFVSSSNSIVQGLVNRSAWDAGKPGSTTWKVNEMFKAKTGRDLDDPSARAMQGFLVMCDAINRAKSTDAEKIRVALTQTDLKPEQIIMGFKGVKFDAKGNNVLASTLLIQLKGDTYQAVWPKANATTDLVLPYKGWQ